MKYSDGRIIANSRILLGLGTSKAPIASVSSCVWGGCHDSGRGLKLNFRTSGNSDPSGDLPLSGAKDSKDVTLCNNDIFPALSILPRLVLPGMLEDRIEVKPEN